MCTKWERKCRKRRCAFPERISNLFAICRLPPPPREGWSGQTAWLRPGILSRHANLHDYILRPGDNNNCRFTCFYHTRVHRTTRRRRDKFAPRTIFYSTRGNSSMNEARKMHRCKRARVVLFSSSPRTVSGRAGRHTPSRAGKVAVWGARGRDELSAQTAISISSCTHGGGRNAGNSNVTCAGCTTPLHRITRAVNLRSAGGEGGRLEGKFDLLLLLLLSLSLHTKFTD